MRFQQSIWCVFCWNFAGDSGIALCISAIINLWNSRVFNGSIWMDTCQVLPLPFLPLFHTLSLHVLGHVDSCPYPKCSSCCNYIISCLWNLESIRRLFGSTSSKLLFFFFFGVAWSLQKTCPWIIWCLKSFMGWSH